MANRKFDVFLSFHGKDTRKTLVDHLYHRLTSVQINVFLDNEKLEKGADIGFNLENAIHNSHILIPIFSKNYARSAWCLNEVRNMIESRGTVMPIFYDVEPHEVRHQRGPFAEAFQAHRNNHRCSEYTINEWCRALHAACSSSGWSLPNDFDGYEGKLVNTVTSQIRSKLHTRLQVAKFPVGIEERAAQVIALLQMESEESVITVGIYGMGGTGKTTLAMAVFNTIRSKFKASCFVPDVRNTKQNELHSKIRKDLVNIDFPIKSIGQGTSLNETNLSAVNALVVLDDVDDRNVVDALRGDWLHLNSRIIVTTRDKGVLDEKCNDKFYHVDELEYDQALQLFSWHAFSRPAPDRNYQDLSEKIVKACQGLPLTIEVIAGLLYDKRDFKIWLEALEQLKNAEINKIEERLRISYEDLNDTEKEIFLDIACFFIGSQKSKGLSIWEGSGWCANLAIHNLHAKSLIKLTPDDRLVMHDILRDMGRAIVRRQNIDNLGKRSRLWDEKDVRKVFKDKRVTKSLQGIVYDSLKWKSWNTQELEPMHNLRLLSMSNIIIEGDFGKLPSQLRWLRWNNCSLKCLPKELKMKNIAVLELPQSYIKQVWDEQLLPKVPKNMKILNLNNCVQLESLPDFSKLRSLVKVELHGCWSLTTLPDSIGGLIKLEYLDLSNCENLKELPESIAGLVSLQILNLSHCQSLQTLPDALGKLTSIKELVLTFTAIAEIPDFFTYMCHLETLSIDKCKGLIRLPKSIGALQRLHTLNMDYCSVVTLPQEIGQLLQLEELNLSSCHNLLELPEDFGKLGNLRILRMNENGKLTKLPPSFLGLGSLQILEAIHCGLEDLSTQMGMLMSSEVIHLQYSRFFTLQKDFKDLRRLTKLILHDCDKLLELSFLPDSLVYVDIGNCRNLSRVSDLSNMKHLETLVMCNCEKLKVLPGVGSLEALVDLNITGCKNLKSGSVKGLNTLKLLERLHLGGTGVIVSNFQEWSKGRELIFYANSIPGWFDYQMQTTVGMVTLSNRPLMDVLIPTREEKVRCIGVIFCFISHDKETGIDATINRGGLEVLRTQIVRNRNKDSKENGRDELHLFICHENHEFVRSLENGDRICIWARSLHPYPRLSVKEGGIHFLYRREGMEQQQQQEGKLYHQLFRDLTWIQWSWAAWKNLPMKIDMHPLAAYDLASCFINRTICTHSLSPVSPSSWGNNLRSMTVVHMVTEKQNVRREFEEAFEVSTELVGGINVTNNETTMQLNPILLDSKKIGLVDGRNGRSKWREDGDICVGDKWLEWKRLGANGRSEFLIELGVRVWSSSSDFQTKKLEISSIWEHGPNTFTSKKFKQSSLILNGRESLEY
eukprot:Gb_09197 [translate_table: standard]